MTNRSYGHKYSELGDKYQTAAEIAKLMRRDIKQAIAGGLLPAEAKYRVNVENYSGGRSINIRVEDFPGAWEDCDGYKVGQPRVAGRGLDLCSQYFCAARVELLGEDRPGAEPHQRLTAEADAARMTLERIYGAYNHDGSDSMTDYFDVNYYGQVNFETTSGAEFRAAEAAKLKARREALDSAAAGGALRRVTVYGSKGRKQTTHDAVDVNGRAKLVCGAASPHMAFPAKDGAELTCSRCAKREAAAKNLPVRARIKSAKSHYRLTVPDRWIVTVTRGSAVLESHIVAEGYAAALELAGEAIARLTVK